MKGLVGAFLKEVPRDHMFTLVDVGSMGITEAERVGDGEWAHCGDDIRIFGFEPDEREFSKLASLPNRSFLNVALSQKSEDLKLYISRESGKTSVYRPNFSALSSFPRAERFETVNEVLIPASRVGRLDTTLSQHQVLDVDFLKLDTQGSELSILRGSQDYLCGSILGVNVEVEFFEIYKDQPLFADVDSYMRANGFQLMDLRKFSWKRSDHSNWVGRGQLVFGDALYFKTPEAFIASLENSDARYAQNKTIKFVAACLVYGMRDYAVFLLNLACRHGYIAEHLKEQLAARIKADDRQLRNVWFYGYRFFRSFLLIVKRRMFPRSWQDSVDSDWVLGNPRVPRWTELVSWMEIRKFIKKNRNRPS
ncbi:MAG: hypothetical protein CMH81_00780 [Nitrospiraceae bacterium]|nr:hypothetical protein [Nitrospiraceae bacterium]